MKRSHQVPTIFGFGKYSRNGVRFFRRRDIMPNGRSLAVCLRLLPLFPMALFHDMLAQDIADSFRDVVTGLWRVNPVSSLIFSFE